MKKSVFFLEQDFVDYKPRQVAINGVSGINVIAFVPLFQKNKFVKSLQKLEHTISCILLLAESNHQNFFIKLFLYIASERYKMRSRINYTS